MKKPTSSHDREELRLQHMANAGAETTRLLEQADIRGIGPEMVAIIVAQILAARNPTLAGKVLYALEMSIQKYPIVKIIGEGTITVEPQPDGSYGVARPIKPECSTCACTIRCADDPHADVNPLACDGPAV